MRTLGKLPMLVFLAGLAACANTPQQVDSSQPTVTYRYKPGEAEVASANASNYCAEHYNGRAEVVARQLQGSTYTATYQCVRQ